MAIKEATAELFAKAFGRPAESIEERRFLTDVEQRKGAGTPESLGAIQFAQQQGRFEQPGQAPQQQGQQQGQAPEQLTPEQATGAEQVFNTLQKKIKEVDDARKKLFSETLKQELKTTLMSSPQIQELIKQRKESQKQVLTAELAPGEPSEVRDPLLRRGLAREQRGELAGLVSDVTGEIQTRQTGIGQVISRFEGTREKELEAQQESLQNIQTLLGEAREQEKFPLELEKLRADIGASRALEAQRLDGTGTSIGNTVPTPTFEEFISQKLGVPFQDGKAQLSITPQRRQNLRAEYDQFVQANTQRNLSSLSPFAQQVVQNPGLMNGLTPTVAGEIMTEAANAGIDLSPFAINKVGDATRKDVARLDSLEKFANDVKSIIETSNIDTGPFATRRQRLAQVSRFFGKASPEFKKLDALSSRTNAEELSRISGAAVTPEEFERLRPALIDLNLQESSLPGQVDNFIQQIVQLKADKIIRATQSAQELLGSVVQQGQDGDIITDVREIQ